MAHQLTIRKDGTAEMAFTGDRGAIWHGLGNQLDDGADIDTWKKQAGMDWEVFQSAVSYRSMDGEHVFPKKQVLFRSDNKTPLSIVSNDYKIVQPGEVLEFFRDLTQLHGMKLSTAGTLFEGKRFWALAEIGKSFEIAKGDEVNGYLLLVTSVDGTLATQARLTSTRVVCNNTLTVAIDGTAEKMVKVSHRQTWDPKAVKIDLDLVDHGWDKFRDSIEMLSEIRVSDDEVRSYFQKKFYMPEVPAEQQGWGATKRVNELMALYRNGTGSQYTEGTAWGIVNAATELFTHGSGRKGGSQQFWDSYFGTGDRMKNEVFHDMLELAV